MVGATGLTGAAKKVASGWRGVRTRAAICGRRSASMKLPRIPKTHPLLEHAQLAMLRDCRQFIARELRRLRKIRRLKNA